MRLRFQAGRNSLQGIWFSTNAQTAAIAPGDVVDVAFVPQINDYRGERTVQLNVLDIRPSCKAECSMETGAYRALCADAITPTAARDLLPDRNTQAMVWRYLAAAQTDGQIKESAACLCRKIVRWTGLPLSLGKMMVCLDIFCDAGLIRMKKLHKYMEICLVPTQQKADLSQSRTMQRLTEIADKES